MLRFYWRDPIRRFVSAFMQAVIVLTPIAVAAWWVFKRLRPDYPARTARKGALAFAVFTPISWGVAFPLSTLAGGYSQLWARYPSFALAGAYNGVVAVTASLSLVPCAFTLWVDRHDGDAD